MYHLTCPSCEEVTDSSFVRTGAVVRCPACQQKFRIKSSHVQRVLHTGPRTLDEGDSLLRSDSVDIDPDEVSPVSIDDEGNVVGLSGLSELMRWSDGKATAKNDRRPSKPRLQDKLKARVVADEQTRSPLDKVIDAATSGPGRRAKRGSSRTGRRGKRKRRNQTPLLILAVVIGVLIGGGLVIILINALQERGTTTPPREPGVAHGQDDAATTPPAPPAPDPDPQPDNTTDPSTPGDAAGDSTQPDGGPGPDDTDTHESTDGTPAEPEPDTQTHTNTDTDAGPDEAGDAGDPENPDDPAPENLLGDNGLPLNAPTRLIEGQPIAHEGWYVLDPPRSGNEPTLDAGLSVSEAFKARPFTDELLRVTGKIKNSAGKAVVRGELHMMLADARGEVFAETYVPVVMLGDQAERGVSLPIHSRYRDRIAEVRVGVKVSEWADRLERVEGEQANAVKHDAGPAVRVSMVCPPGEPLDDALIHLRATNEQGALVGQFMVQQRGLGVRPGQWLDLLIATPIDPALKPTEWSARVYRR